jgi:hypothetical protein
MGFGFNLFVIFILLPLIILLLILWLISKRKIFGQTIAFIIVGIIAMTILFSIFQFLTSKKVLDKDDYYGKYTIDKSYFPGKQANWQYDTFRFEIKDNDSIYFYVTDKDKVRKTYKGTISTNKIHQSERLAIHMQQPTHHVLITNPTIYRSVWGFELVFNSPKFSNMYFKKGEWEAE